MSQLQSLICAAIAGNAKIAPRAKVLVMTDVLFKSLDISRFPDELGLLVNFDLPLQKVSKSLYVVYLKGLSCVLPSIPLQQHSH